MNRMKVAAILVTMTSSCLFTAGCGDSKEVSGPVLGQSPVAVPEVVVGANGLLACAKGLAEAKLSFSNTNDLGDAWYSVEQHTGSALYYNHQISVFIDSWTFTVSGTPPNVKAAFVTTLNPDQPRIPSQQPGVAEQPSGAVASGPDVRYERDFTANWRPGLENKFDINAKDFGNGHNTLASIVLCVAPH